MTTSRDPLGPAAVWLQPWGYLSTAAAAVVLIAAGLRAPVAVVLAFAAAFGGALWQATSRAIAEAEQARREDDTVRALCSAPTPPALLPLVERANEIAYRTEAYVTGGIVRPDPGT